MSPAAAAAAAQAVRIHGIPVSQPVRAVVWACAAKRLPFAFQLVVPGGDMVKKGFVGSRSEPFLAKSRQLGTVPVLEETDVDTGETFVLGDSHAIMTYLSTKHGWEDLYPSAPRERATVDWYLHHHHRSTRDVAQGLVAPHFRPDKGITEQEMERSKATVQRTLHALNNGWLAETPFLGTAGSEPTLADIACYSEIGPVSKDYGNLLDLDPFPNVLAWMDRMREVDFHDDVMLPNAIIGDLSSGADPKKMAAGNKAALKRWADFANP